MGVKLGQLGSFVSRPGRIESRLGDRQPVIRHIVPSISLRNTEYDHNNNTIDKANEMCGESGTHQYAILPQCNSYLICFCKCLLKPGLPSQWQLFPAARQPCFMSPRFSPVPKPVHRTPQYGLPQSTSAISSPGLTPARGAFPCSLRPMRDGH